MRRLLNWFGNGSTAKKTVHRHSNRVCLEVECLEDRCLMSGSPLGSTIELPISAGSAPESIVSGPGGTLWFTEPGRYRIGELFPGSQPGAGNMQYTEYATGAAPVWITLGNDGNLWFTENNDRIGELIPGSQPGLANITEYALSSNANPGQIIVGFDGNLWFTEQGLSHIGELIPSGVPGQANIVEYPLGFTPASSLFSITNGPGGTFWFPSGSSISELIPGDRLGVANIVQYSVSLAHQGNMITEGLDGNIWYTETGSWGANAGNYIGELIPSSQLGVANIVDYPLDLNLNVGLFGITPDNAGNLWFTEGADGVVGEFTPGSQLGLANIVRYPAASPTQSGLGDITMGPDGNMWYVESGSDRIGTMTTVDPNGIYVEAAYQDVLGRFPDPGGLAYWNAQLDAGMSRATFASALTHSTEYYSNFITAAYNRYLGRAPDAAGLAAWVGGMQAGLTDEQLEAGFIGSDEYIANHGGAGAGWVEGMYQDLLGRTPAQAEVDGWVQALADGMASTQVAYGFAASPERETQRVTADYQNFLGRTPDAGGLASWVNGFVSGGLRNEDVVAGFVASDEYFSKHSG